MIRGEVMMEELSSCCQWYLARLLQSTLRLWDLPLVPYGSHGCGDGEVGGGLPPVGRGFFNNLAVNGLKANSQPPREFDAAEFECD